ncbi:MAG: hypothetical protein ACRED5_09120 [Propylenella sp.]
MSASFDQIEQVAPAHGWDSERKARRGDVLAAIWRFLRVIANAWRAAHLTRRAAGGLDEGAASLSSKVRFLSD